MFITDSHKEESGIITLDSPEFFLCVCVCYWLFDFSACHFSCIRNTFFTPSTT